jgi:hypothetical protein
MGDDSPVWIVATVRSEFLSTAPERAGLAEVIDDPLVIEPLSRARLPAVIQQPAQRAGLQFAAGLVEQMLEETTGGDALPLLAYMLRELYQQAGADGIVTVAEYQALGGVIGALQSRADRLTDELGRRGWGELVLPTLTKFAVVAGEAEPTSRRIPRSALSRDEQAIADAFVEARLLTSSVDVGGETVVGVAHEALLRQWRPLHEAIEASRASLRMRSELERLAADWDLGGRDDSYLERRARFAAFEEWAVEQASQLEKQEAQLRQQAIRLRELAEFDRQSNISGGVFISYSHDDKDIVDALAHRLAADQINYWLDEKDLFVGDVVDKAISRGIQESLLFIIVLTPTSISSKWVERELDEAAHAESEGLKIILPIVAKDLSPEQIPARLRRKLYVDVSKSFDDGYARLTRSIHHHLRSQSVQSSSAH